MGRLQANYNPSKNNKISINKQNLGGGKLSLFEFFNPKNISNLQLWTKQGSLTATQDYVAIRLTFTAGYAAGDIDTTFYLLGPANPYYEGDQFGFYIEYNESYGKWYLYDPNGTDTAEAEDLFGPWTTYGDLDGFDLIDYDNDSYTSYNPVQYTWSDVSGKNNHLITRKNPVSGGIVGGIIKGLETKILRTPFKTTNTINDLALPFTIYIVLLDNYTGVNTRKILGTNNLYLESTSFSFRFHTFALKYYGNALSTICSFQVDKFSFGGSATVGPSILRISNNYTTSSFSPDRSVTLRYYNSFGSLLANGTAIDSGFAAGNLFLGNNNFGIGNLGVGTLHLSEVLVYNKFLSTEEDDSINKYLQRKYYGKLL